MHSPIWITWEVQRRNRVLSQALGLKLFEFAELHSGKGVKKYLKYITGPMKTIGVLLRERPSLVVCENPSIVLAFMMILIKIITGLPVIVDAHYAGIFPLDGNNRFLMWVSKFIQKHATAVIVTNRNHKGIVESNGGKGVILQDMVPHIDRSVTTEVDARSILMVCSFANDEPYEEVFKAAELIQNDVTFYVTGNYKKRNIDPASVPPNVHLTGFVSEERFIELLNSVDVVMAFTDREDCLMCACYEAVATEKPMIISDSEALRDYFKRGAIYTQHTPGDIATSILNMFDHYRAYKQAMQEFKPQLVKEWERTAAPLRRIIYQG